MVQSYHQSFLFLYRAVSSEITSTRDPINWRCQYTHWRLYHHLQPVGINSAITHQKSNFVFSEARQIHFVCGNEHLAIWILCRWLCNASSFSVPSNLENMEIPRSLEQGLHFKTSRRVHPSCVCRGHVWASGFGFRFSMLSPESCKHYNNTTLTTY